MGRRSKFTARQKAEIVLSVLQKKATVAETCRAQGISEVTLKRWRDQALAGMTPALGDRTSMASREAQLEKEIEQLERTLGRVTSMADIRGKALRRLT